MGYDIYASGTIRIDATKAKEAFAALTAAHKEEYGTEVLVPKGGSYAKRLVETIDKLSGCGFAATVAEDDKKSVLIDAPENSFRNQEEDEWIFDAIGRYVDEDNSFEFSGEDGYKWMWTFGKAGMKDISSEVVYGADCHAPAICKDLVALLYDGNKIKDHEDPQAVLDRIEVMLRKHGFGPFAGLDALDALAKAVE